MSEPASTTTHGHGCDTPRVLDGREMISRRSVGRGLHRALGVPLLTLALTISACGGSEEGASPPPEIIARETFIAAYVDLRMAALRDTAGISTVERERILRSHGISPEELLRFAEVYGEDPGALQEVWSDIQDRIREAREEATLQREEDDGAPSDPEPAEDPNDDGGTADDDGAPDAGAVETPRVPVPAAAPGPPRRALSESRAAPPRC